jgi:DNA-binding NarL/FixJ family response regulator
VAGAIRRLIRSLGSRAAHEDTDALHNLRDLEAELESAWKVAIAGLRRSGFSDTDIGTELGITKQAVQKRWPRPSKEDSR